MIKVSWIESAVSSDLEVRQIYGFIFDLEGRILLLEDDGHYTLPGGKPEGDESMVETLARESLEEAQVTFKSANYLGYQLVEGDEKYAQVRIVALLGNQFPSAIDPSTGKQYKRWWAPPAELNNLLKWGESGDKQIECAIIAASGFGVSWSGSPLSSSDVSPG